MRKLAANLLKQREGSAILETAFIVPVMVLMIVGAVDLGRAYYVAIEVASAAHAGALYGIQNPTDTSGMITAAELDAPDITTLSPSAAYGCECSDGGSVVPSCTTAPGCTYNYVNYVSVTAAATYTPLMPYPGLPSSITLISTTRMRAGGD